MKSRLQLEAEAIAKYRSAAKKWGISEEDAEKKARALMPNNSDRDLREFIRKPIKGLSINALDPAHAAADHELQKMEREVSKTYNRATDEMTQKLNKYLANFNEADLKKKASLEAGEITQEEYNAWRRSKITGTERWTRMRDVLAKDASNANDIAKSIINGHMPDVYAENHNYATYQVERGLNMHTSFTLYDKRTAERLLRKEHKLIWQPKPQTSTAAKAKDLRWNNKQIQGELLQGILQGESNEKIAKRMQNVTGSNRKASMRYARTMTTAAENAGRLDTLKDASDHGVHVKKVWSAVLDERTRPSHRLMDGVAVDLDEEFPNGCMEPGDPDCDDPGETMNCRCSLDQQLEGFERNYSNMDWRYDGALRGMSYEDWKAGKNPTDDEDEE